jgi:DNA-binding NarL/FixJ family response regulator
LDTIRNVLAPDHPIATIGRHMLEEMRHVLEALAPGVFLIELTLDNGLEPPLSQQAESPLASPQVFVLQGYQNHAYIFGLLTSGPATGLTEHNALQMIAEAMQGELSNKVVGQSHRIVTKVPTHQPEGLDTKSPKLTTREREVLRELATGKTDQVIGEHLNISTSTVRYHLQNIYRKLKVKQRCEAILWVVRTGLAEESGIPEHDN